jgi:hypothetical protein
MSAGVNCDLTVAGTHLCYGYLGLSAAQIAAVQSACQSGGGQIVTSCSTTGQLGCCTFSMAGYTIDECFYCPGDGATDSQACMALSGATWSPSGTTCGG